MKIFHFLLVVLCISIISCSSDDSNELTISVSTVDAFVNSQGGVTLSGKIDNNLSVNDVGFEYANDSLLSTKKVSVSTIKSLSNDQFSYFISTGIENNKKYFYRAYARNNTSTSFGEIKSFLSKGSVAPKIDSLSNTTGLIADTLQIFGKYFKDINYKTLVDFSEINSQVISINDSVITCKVPTNINNITSDIRVKIDDRADIFSSFTLASPVIKSISPLNATFRDEITITGNNFDFEASRNKVYFGNVEALITYADKNIIKVLVPDDLENSSEKIKVIAQLQEAVFENEFKLIPPKINFIPQNVYTNQDILIEGVYFHPINSKNIITIENITVNITSGDTQELNTKIPLGPFPRRKAIVKLQLLDIIVEYSLDLNILDNWVMVSNNIPIRYYGFMRNAVVANGNAFIITKSQDIFDESSYLWKFNQHNFSWAQENIPFNIDVYQAGGIVETDGTNIYVYLPNEDNDFWMYNTLTNVWSKRPSFIGSKRSNATHFSINGEIYIGLGVDFEPYIPVYYSDFYKYNPTNNSWSQISDVPFGPYNSNGRHETSSFVINEIGYFVGGARTTGDIDCWSYSPSSDTWTRIADFSTPRNYTASFSLNGLGYVTGGTPIGGSNRKDCWEYNPSTNKWTQIENVGHIERGRHFSFVLNGKAYVGGGGIYNSGGSNGYDLYEFIP